MKYLKLFQTEVEYTTYRDSEDFITPNVSCIVDNTKIFYNQYTEDEDFIIMTYESNPAVMNVCYYQGWAASPDVMYKSEAEMVTDIGTAFRGLQGNTNTYDYGIYGYGSNDLTEAFTSFDEFKYFTGVTSIDDWAFYNCTNLTSITIPDSVTTIGEHAFGYCYGLTSIIIPNSVTSIEHWAFSSCTSLTSITIPDSVTTIGVRVFQDCISLPVIDNIRYADTYLVESTDKSLTTYNIKEGTKFIGEDAFSICINLTSIVIPDSVTYIGNSAFYECSSLTSITIPDSVTYIGGNAFTLCSSLTSIAIPDSVTSIWGGTFAACTGLTSITIPYSVTSIDEYAFNSCSGLAKVTIGLGVTSIGQFAFMDCIRLSEITCLAPSFPMISSYTFHNVNTGGILKVPAGSDYSSWMSADAYYLGYYRWTIQEI